ncbi:MAG: tRNA uridine-5-carboxymethylaminomethyl(34) synthesis GTPase MnmE [Muribaculaceae bacterium]|nr:tRNA uridine-5-carboxymethylaminomethyl(34) synthesis GTPase MnmE [Muribaculaceae bacterium]
MEQFEVGIDGSSIVAVATAPGTGGIAVVRVSGKDAIKIVDSAWKGASLVKADSHTVHLGKYVSTAGDVLDECVATVFRAPNSFTGENIVELGLHGSRWIQREVVADLIRRGARGADRGEFTRRAFMNGRLDLAQAEGVADLIAASSKAAHALAMSQTRGAFSRGLDEVREKLVEFAALLELELDFSEEDVEFADRTRLKELAKGLLARLDRLAASYSSGAALKEGVPVVIAGIPNAGKSSLLNLLLGDDKAIVSDIPGTTRDTIEDTAEIDGVLFRFIDTAGLRATTDTVENLGIDRARAKMRRARIVIWIFDPTAEEAPQEEEYGKFASENPDVEVIRVVGKGDKITASPLSKGMLMSMKSGEGLDTLRQRLTASATGGYDPQSEFIVTNARHYEALLRSGEALRRALEGLESNLSADFIAQDVREATHHLGTITGAVTTDTLLHHIFQNFCIGK